jgi:guanidinopropionase
MLRDLRGCNVVGNVVCLMPSKDAANQITAMNAMVVMFEIVCLIADRIRWR